LALYADAVSATQRITAAFTTQVACQKQTSRKINDKGADFPVRHSECVRYRTAMSDSGRLVAACNASWSRWCAQCIASRTARSPHGRVKCPLCRHCERHAAQAARVAFRRSETGATRPKAMLRSVAV